LRAVFSTVRWKRPKKGPHQSPRQERFYIILPLAKNDVILSFVGFVQPKPNPPKVDLLQKAFTNMLPRCAVTFCASGAESRPVSIIKEDFQATSLGELARFDVEDDDPGLCGRNL